MPSEYTDRLGFELQETGENLNSWGLRLNGALNLIDEAIAGVATIALTGNRALTNTINTPNEARKAILVFTDGGLSAVPTITIPPEQKLYYVENRGSTYAIMFTAGGVTASLPAGRKGFVLCTGADVSLLDPTSEAIASVATPAAAAVAAASAAAGSATNAAGSATNASGSATLAQKWASNPENVTVTGSLYSALHYATKAAASAVAAAQFDPSSYYIKSVSDARYLALAGGTLTGNVFDTVVDKGTVSSGTVTFDVGAGAVQRFQVGGAVTVALSNKPTTAWEIEITLVNGGAFAVTWPTTSWLKGDGTVSATFSDMAVTLQAAGSNTVVLWGTGSGTVYGRAG